MKNDNSGKTNMSQAGRPVATGISWRLFGTLILFVLVILIVVWTFQVLLLNRFYADSKLDEFNSTRDAIFESIDDKNELQKIVIKCGGDTNSCIRLFRLDMGTARQIAGLDINPGCILHHLQSDDLYQLYNDAVENGGTFTRRIANPNDESRAPSAISVTVREHTDGYTYILMQDSELIPLTATVTTLERQFGWIMFILIIGALIVALALSRVIAIPMEKMSRSARRLAKGDYNAVFEGRGYREAEELAEALNYASRELAKNDDLQRELVANISHDLRTPLTMIKGYSEVMRDIPGENTPENVQVIIDETERLTELVNDVLDLSKIRAGTHKPEQELFDLTETVSAVLLRYEKLTERDGYSVTFHYEENATVSADRTMILQVLYNLVNNSINYTGEDKRVAITQTVESGRVRISVTDTGEGIAKKDIPYIWDRYYKVDKVHKRARVGTGLGLSIVKSILEAHNAKYGVDSEVGSGSTFWFELDTVESAETE